MLGENDLAKPPYHSMSDFTITLPDRLLRGLLEVVLDGEAVNIIAILFFYSLLFSVYPLLHNRSIVLEETLGII